MKIKVINPNASEWVTERIAGCALEAARAGTQVTVERVATGPRAIESHYDMVCAGPGFLQAVRSGETEGCDGYVAACFGDPGINAAREIASGPMIGMGEAALHAASYLSSSYVVVTTIPRMDIFARRLVLDSGTETRCRGIVPIGMDIGAITNAGTALSQDVIEGFRSALEQTQAEAVILGSAAFAGISRPLGEALTVPVLDGIALAVKIVEGLVDLGLKTSRRGALATPATVS